MNLFEGLINWDKQLLLVINSYHLPWLDRFMWLVSDTVVWIPVLLIFAVVLVKNKQSRAMLIFLAFALLILFTDQISSSVIKPLVERLRPTHDPDFGDWVNVVNNYRGGKYGFVSSHAANVFAFAGLSLLLFRSGIYSVVILLWAALISFSRIYLGVHYPLDVICGGLFGFCSAVVMYLLYLKTVEKPVRSRGRNERSHKDLTSGEFKKKDIYFLTFSLVLLLVTLAIASVKLAW
jgi:undecaprenyl-diphosphatase